MAALLLLWERWDYMRGPCPRCGSQALGVGFNGFLSTGSVAGHCLRCARGVTRDIGGIGTIVTCLRACLGDTPYRLWPGGCEFRPTRRGEIVYGGWGWSLGPLPPGIVAVLQELGANLSGASGDGAGRAAE